MCPAPYARPEGGSAGGHGRGEQDRRGEQQRARGSHRARDTGRGGRDGDLSQAVAPDAQGQGRAPGTLGGQGGDLGHRQRLAQAEVRSGNIPRALELYRRLLAAELLSRAAALFPGDHPDRGAILPDLGEALSEAGDLARAENVLAEAGALAERAGDRGLQAHVVIVGLMLLESTDPERTGEEAVAQVEALIPVLEELGDEHGLARAHRFLGDVHMTRCRFATAHEAFERAGDEIRDAEKRLYGELIDEVLEDLRRFVGRDWDQEDDITLVMLERTGGAERLIGEGPKAAAVPAGPDDVESSASGTDPPDQTLLRLTIPAVTGNERLAMERVAEAVAPLGLEPARLERLKTAVSEATMNAIEYGSKSDPAIPVDIAADIVDRNLVLRITDRALSGAVPTVVTAPSLKRKLAGEEKGRGWGLFLIRHMVDAVDVAEDDGGGQTVTLTIHLDGAGPAGALEPLTNPREGAADAGPAIQR